jgi:hypothetical protein
VTRPSPQHEGDPDHPDHARYLCELGATVYAASTVAGIASDILRVHLGEDTMDLVDDPLGTLIGKLDQHDKSGSTIPGLSDFVAQLRIVLPMRNDVIHAVPVLHGLHRRTKKDPYRWSISTRPLTSKRPGRNSTESPVWEAACSTTTAERR